jgi:hypothetical protein
VTSLLIQELEELIFILRKEWVKTTWTAIRATEMNLRAAREEGVKAARKKEVKVSCNNLGGLFPYCIHYEHVGLCSTCVSITRPSKRPLLLTSS